MMFLKISKSKQWNIDIYKNKDIQKYFNEINLLTVKNLRWLDSQLNKKYFEIPCLKNRKAWGYEVVFLPFTNKLFKILVTTKNDTSLQLHATKVEKWYPINTCTVSNGENDFQVKKGNEITIENGVVHCLKKNSVVFEVQDNILFDNDVIHLYDANNRKIRDELEYLKYISSSKDISISSPKPVKNILKNLFVFVLYHDEFVDKKCLLKQYHLYYFKTISFNNFNDISNFVFIEAEFILGAFIDYGVN